MPLDEAGGRSALAHLLPLFWEAVTGGVQDYFAKYQNVAHVHRTTTMRSIMRDHIVDRLRALTDRQDDVDVLDKNQTTYFDCCAQFRVLIKKSDEDGLVELAKTQASFEFQCNERQGVLDPSVVPEVTNLYLTYVPNSEDPERPSAFLVCPAEEGWYWRIEIEPPPARVVPISDPPSTPPEGGEEFDLVRVPREKQIESE